jgi:predicted Zn-dependent protease
LELRGGPKIKLDPLADRISFRQRESRVAWPWITAMQPRFAKLLRLLVAPASVAAWLLLAGEASGHGSVHDRLAALEIQIAASPTAAPLYLRRAALLGEHEDWVPALRDCDRAQHLDPGIEVDLVRGHLLLAAARPAEAVTALDRFLRHHPGHPPALISRARALIQLARPPAAIADLRAAVHHSATLEPDLVVELADALAAHGKPLEAITALDSGIAKLGAAPALALRALALELTTENFDAALARVAAMQAAAPRPEPWLARRAAILAQADRLPEARAAWQALIAQLAALPPAQRDSHALSLLMAEARQALAALPPAAGP